MFDTQMRRVKEAKLKIQKPRNMKRCFTERIDSVIPFFISKYSIKTLPKDGEALYSQQKQDRALTVAQ